MKKGLIFTLMLALLATFGCRKDKNIEKNVSAQSFLSGDDFTKLNVEVQYVTGFAPTAATIANLKSFLEKYLNKPGGIAIVQTEVSSSGKSVYTIDDVKAIETAHRSQKTDGSTLTAYFLFADGDYAGNAGSSKVLGIAYGNSSMVIFEKTIRDFSGGLTQPSVTTLESAVVHHEFGHILGLVNNGTPMQTAHQDAANGKHCDDKNCLMYYATETSDVVANLVGGTIPELDSRCAADLKANGGK
ncbi:MAG: membrane metalloprotease [Flavobacteriales bacterium]|nr:membrane metalloprotease [Flavobacteriales bacterium]